MGYAEFGGTGSVKWRVEYDDQNGSTAIKETNSAKLRGRGRDKNGGTTPGTDDRPGDILTVVCTDATVVSMGSGSVTLHVQLKHKRDQVKLTWGNTHTTPLPDPDPDQA